MAPNISRLFSQFSRGETKEILGLDVLGVGTWPASPREVPIGLGDLHNIARHLNNGIASPVPVGVSHIEDEAFYKKIAEALDVPAELVVSNTPNREGIIGLGVVHNARVMGERLYVDVKDVPTKLAALVEKEGWGFNYHSPKLVPYWPGQHGNVDPIKGPIMCALTLLGAKQPAFTEQAGLATATVMAHLGMDDRIPVYTLEAGAESMEYSDEPSSRFHCASCGSMNAVYRDGMVKLEKDDKEGDDKMGMGDFDGGIGQDPNAWPSHKPTDDFDKQLDGKEDRMNEADMVKMEQRISESVAKILGEQIEAKFAKIEERFAEQEKSVFSSSLNTAAAGWKHLEEDDRATTVASILALQAADPDMAQKLIEQNTKLAAKFEQDNKSGDNGDPNYRSQAAPFINGMPSFLFEQGEDRQQEETDINKGVLKFMQDNQVDYSEAVQMMSSDDRWRERLQQAIMEGSLRGGSSFTMVETP